MNGIRRLSILACWLLTLAPTRTLAQSTQFQFKDMLDTSGIDFEHSDGGTGNRYVVEAMTGGLAFLDFNGDGLQDIYFLNGQRLPRSDSTDVNRTNRLYQNLGAFQFRDVTETAGVGDTSFGLGVVCGDYDNDGDEDIYVTNFGPNKFFSNNGDGTFTELSKFTRTSGGHKFGAGAVFFDMDTDGDLDLYCANYQKFALADHKIRMIGGHQFHPGPRDYPPEQDLLFRNNGDGTFTDASIASGVAAVSGTGMGVIATDIDGDHDLDLVVANDSYANHLLVNDGSGFFTEEGLLSGIAYDRRGHPNGNMGVDCGDVDNDGQIDIVTTTYQQEMPVLYRNSGSGFFSDATNTSRIDRSLFAHVNWGLGLVDFDNDGDRDLYIACGHFMDNIRFIDDSTSVKVPNYLLQNDGTGRFRAVQTAGTWNTAASSRGSAFDDLDGNGSIDIVVQNANSRPTVLRNDLPATNEWVKIRLIGRTDNRQGVGARVSVISNEQQQVSEVYAGRGYQSHYGSVLHFGLGNRRHRGPILIRVDWRTGPSQTISMIDVNSEVVVIQPNQARYRESTP